jgi:hypothetical protein
LKKICPFHKNRAVNLHTFMKNRPERLICFLVVWLTMFSCISGKGQNISKEAQLTPDFKHLCLPGTNAEARNARTGIEGPESRFNLSWGTVFAASNTAQQNSIPSDIYYIQSGFFCKREWEIEKATHIPLRFRLGSLADCNFFMAAARPDAFSRS